MKYQIYLNKETSDFVEEYARKDSKRVNTFIKELIEGLVRITKATAEATEKEIKRAQNEH